MNKPTWTDVAIQDFRNLCGLSIALACIGIMAWMVMRPDHFTATLGKMADYVLRIFT